MLFSAMEMKTMEMMETGISNLIRNAFVVCFSLFVFCDGVAKEGAKSDAVLDETERRADGLHR